MAQTLGTAAQNTLAAIGPWTTGGGGFTDAQIAAIAQAILDETNAHNILPGAFSRNGLLFLPSNRGVIKVLPGDYVGVDTAAGVGWPIVVSANAIAGGSWDHT